MSNLKRVKFRKGSEAEGELDYILNDVTYDDPWHDTFDLCIQRYMSTGFMSYRLAQEVHYRFIGMRTYTAYDECRRYERAVDSIIDRTRKAFPEMCEEGQLEY